MATEPTIDLANLLAPIEGPDPAGIDLKPDYSPTAPLIVIGDARQAARDIEAQIAKRVGGAPEDGPTPMIEWRKVFSLAPKLIASRSKNFEVALWLAEALLRLEGFAGLRDGFALAAGLLQNFPEGVYPRPEEGEGPEETVAKTTSVLGTLLQPIRAIPLSDNLDLGPVAFWQYQIAIDPARANQPNRLSIEDFERSVRSASPDFLRDLKDDLRGAVDACVALQDQLDARAGRNAPSCGTIRRELEAIRELVVNLVGESAGASAPTPEPEIVTDSPQTVVVAKPAPQAVAVDAINNRDDAFRQLLKIAEYFRKAEPHSPIAPAIEDAVRRGRMSLQELIAELIPTDEPRRNFYLNAGIKPP